jgi:hypothetical protein
VSVNAEEKMWRLTDRNVVVKAIHEMIERQRWSAKVMERGKKEAPAIQVAGQPLLYDQLPH